MTIPYRPLLAVPLSVRVSSAPNPIATLLLLRIPSISLRTPLWNRLVLLVEKALMLLLLKLLLLLNLPLLAPLVDRALGTDILLKALELLDELLNTRFLLSLVVRIPIFVHGAR